MLKLDDNRPFRSLNETTTERVEYSRRNGFSISFAIGYYGYFKAEEEGPSAKPKTGYFRWFSQWLQSVSAYKKQVGDKN